MIKFTIVTISSQMLMLSMSELPQKGARNNIENAVVANENVSASADAGGGK